MVLRFPIAFFRIFCWGYITLKTLDYRHSDQIKQIMADTAADLNRDIARFRSWVYGSRMHEANLTFHLGSRLKQAGYHFYMEVPVQRNGKKGKAQAFDALALNPQTRSGFLVESKYLFSGSVTKLNGDLAGLSSLRHIDEWSDLKDYQISNAMILLHTFDKNIATWWTEDYQNDAAPQQKRVPHAWPHLRKVLLKGHSGTHLLGRWDSDGSSLWMLWALFPL